MEQPSKSKYLLYLDWSLLVLAFLVLVGWQLDIVVLKSFTADLTAMNPLTAITFMVAAFWLLLYTNHKKNSVSLLAGLFVLLVGFIHYTSYLFQMDGIRLDDILFQTKVETSGINSHMAPITAFLFLLTGFIMVTEYATTKWLVIWRNSFTIIIFIIAYASILGYVFGRESAYRVEGVSTIALNTAILFLVLSTSLFFCDTNKGCPNYSYRY